MNQQFNDMHLTDTHFTNVTGAYDEDHYTTAHEMALILANAMQNSQCAKALSTTNYTTAKTSEHPDGTPFLNQFLYRLQSRDLSTATALAAKSGYLTASGSTACSYGYDQQGQAYVCVTAKASSSWKTVYDHQYLYANYMN